jgi:sugar phosphate permease
VRRRREQIGRWTGLARRIGYLAFLTALVAFLVALATDFSSAMAAIVVTALVVGCVVLAPAIIMGYAVKAAERDDRERGL